MNPFPMDKLEQKFKQDSPVQGGSTDNTTDDSPKSSRYKKGVSISDYLNKSQILSDSSVLATGTTSGGPISRVNGNSGGKSSRQNYFPIETIKLMPIKIKDVAHIFKNNSEYEVLTPTVVKMKESDMEKMATKQKQKRSSKRPHQIKDSLELLSNLSPIFIKSSSNNEQKMKPLMNEHTFKYQYPDHNNTRSFREPNELQIFAIPHIAHTKAEPMVGNKSYRAKSKKKSPIIRSSKGNRTKRSQTSRNRNISKRKKIRSRSNGSRNNRNRPRNNRNRSRKNRNRSKSRDKSGVRPMYSYLSARERSSRPRDRSPKPRPTDRSPRPKPRERSTRRRSRDRSPSRSRGSVSRSRDKPRRRSRPQPPIVCSSKIPPETNKRKVCKPTYQLVPPGWTHLFQTDEDCNPYPLCDNIYKPPAAVRKCPNKEPRDIECRDMMQESEYITKRRITQNPECASSRPFLRNCDELLDTYCCDNDGKLQFIQPGLCSKKKYLWTNEYAIIPNTKVNLIDPCEDLDSIIYPRANNPCIRDGRGNPLTDCIGRPLRDPIGKKFLKFSPNGSLMAANFHGNIYTGQPPLCVKCPFPERSCAPDTTHNWWMGCGYPIQPDMSPFFKKVLRKENREWC